MTLAPFDWIVLLLYFAGLTALGLCFGKGQTSRDEYQLGGRRVHWLLAGGSLMATLLSTVSFVAVPGEMVRHGPGLLTSLLALPFAVAVIGYILIPAFKALPYRTAYEYLDGRFGGRARRLSAVIFLIHTVVWMGLIIYTCCLVVTTATGWSLTAAILLVGVATTF
jgi:SSS family solute:Na+ symporter